MNRTLHVAASGVTATSTIAGWEHTFDAWHVWMTRDDRQGQHVLCIARDDPHEGDAATVDLIRMLGDGTPTDVTVTQCATDPDDGSNVCDVTFELDGAQVIAYHDAVGPAERIAFRGPTLTVRYGDAWGSWDATAGWSGGGVPSSPLVVPVPNFGWMYDFASSGALTGDVSRPGFEDAVLTYDVRQTVDTTGTVPDRYELFKLPDRASLTLLEHLATGIPLPGLTVTSCYIDHATGASVCDRTLSTDTPVQIVGVRLHNQREAWLLELGTIEWSAGSALATYKPD